MSQESEQKRRNRLRYLAVKMGRAYDFIHRCLARLTGRLGKPMAPEIYYAIEHDNSVAVKGRVLLSRKWREPTVRDHPVVNMLQMCKRWATPERPHSLLRITAGGEPAELRSDREGYFEVELPLDQVRSREILIEMPESEVSEPARHEIRRPGKLSRRLVVSDIDDTVLVTHAATTLRMIATTLFGNALTRQLFPGTVELYRALRRGVSEEGSEKNPIAYVTSSPFNLHGLVQLIFKENDLPEGAYFMTNWGLDYEHWFKKSHRDHKLASIRHALDWYPDKTAVLIGDSGQHDTPIYIEIALEHPGRIDQILIRDVSGPERIEHLQSTVETLRDSGTRLAFFSDSAEAAEILLARGWITEPQLRSVRDALAEGEKSRFHRIVDAKPDNG
ncbi:MAG: phosphatase domain-containing protein [Verrucomicrobiales bacterium]